MSQITDVHHEAMRLADEGFVAEFQGDTAAARQLFHKAIELEREAAERLFAELDAEPSRSVLYRSAAVLAQRCGEHREAERLIAAGLAGRPPEEIADELRDLWETVSVERHLELRGLQLAPCELQMSLSGPQVGYGLIETGAFLVRAETAKKLLSRTAEREGQLPFREHGPMPQALAERFEQYIAVPRAASFAISIRFGAPQRQLTLPGFVAPEKVIDVVVECLRMFQDEAVEALRERIPDAAYFRNFVALARRLAPDGRRVTAVGFTAVRRGATSSVTLGGGAGRRWADVNEAGAQPILRLTGELRLADATLSTSNAIALVDGNGVKHKIQVPLGMLADIVRPLWEERVTATVKRRGRMKELVHIALAADVAEEPGAAPQSD